MTRQTIRSFWLLFLLGLPIAIPVQADDKLTEVGEKYARLVLALGQYDPDYVDAFYGPESWKSAAAQEKKPLAQIGAESETLISRLPPPQEEAKDYLGGTAEAAMSELRREFLAKQLAALGARVKMLRGEQLKFDDESADLYDAVAPTFPEEHFKEILAQLDAKVPGTGPLNERYENWRKAFQIPKEKLDTVFQLAIKECRARTRNHLDLPATESFTVEYVTQKSWGGYNWYQGNFRSVIQVNTDLPIYIDRAIDLAAHEGYPGHHVYNVLLEKNLVRDRGWQEFTVYPLFSPQSLIAEGTANFGREIVFPGAERIRFEKEVLFPAAGLSPEKADEYYAIENLVKTLGFAGNEAARRLINGEGDESAAVAWLEKYALMDPARARQRVKFIQRYRSYVINYNLGEEMVRTYIAKTAGDDVARRWQSFTDLLSSPRLPDALK